MSMGNIDFSASCPEGLGDAPKRGMGAAMKLVMFYSGGSPAGTPEFQAYCLPSIVSC